MPRSNGEWEGLVAAANAISDILKRKPKELRIGHYLSPGSILNAYREGDLTFNQAVRELERWSRWKQGQQKKK